MNGDKEWVRQHRRRLPNGGHTIVAGHYRTTNKHGNGGRGRRRNGMDDFFDVLFFVAICFGILALGMDYDFSGLIFFIGACFFMGFTLFKIFKYFKYQNDIEYEDPNELQKLKKINKDYLLLAIFLILLAVIISMFSL